MTPAMLEQRIALKPSELVEELEFCIATKRAAMVWGSPGVGKSAIIASLATQRKGWKFLDMRLVIRDAVDVRGVPFVDEKTGRTMWAIPAEFPTSGQGIWFLDEINAAHPQVQAVAYQLVLDRMLGEYKLPDGWVIMAAGNYESDGGVTHKMPSPLRSRFVHYDLGVDMHDWCKWAISAGIHPMVVAFIRFKPGLLHAFDKNSRSFPCPRTWEFVSDFLKAGADPVGNYATFAGLIGKAAAQEFQAFVAAYRALPDIDEVIKNPASAQIPTEPSVLYAVVTAMAHRVSTSNFGNILKYFDRLPDPEFAVLGVRDCLALVPAIPTSPLSRAAYTAWSVKHSDLLMN